MNAKKNRGVDDKAPLEMSCVVGSMSSSRLLIVEMVLPAGDTRLILESCWTSVRGLIYPAVPRITLAWVAVTLSVGES